ncbi:hypothetical protein JHK82_052568 [Glycine max]|nr:hypothetical protein JHK86_052414 [Glycine max]KAG5082416.1 hypothetical protein JHK84_052454 [Glycine max]KAG5085171.1 hypothetical protein JHK82_052568 [Glycine max]
MDTWLVSQKKVLFEFPVGLRVVAVDHDPTILDNILNMCSRCHYREAKPKRIVEAMNIPGLTREQVASHLQKHRHELLLNTSKGVTLQQNEKTLSNNIESKRREGAYGRFDLTAFGDTSHLSYAALHPEERMEDQWPYYSLA